MANKNEHGVSNLILRDVILEITGKELREGELFYFLSSDDALWNFVQTCGIHIRDAVFALWGAKELALFIEGMDSDKAKIAVKDFLTAFMESRDVTITMRFVKGEIAFTEVTPKQEYSTVMTFRAIPSENHSWKTHTVLVDVGDIENRYKHDLPTSGRSVMGMFSFWSSLVKKHGENMPRLDDALIEHFKKQDIFSNGSMAGCKLELLAIDGKSISEIQCKSPVQIDLFAA